MRAQADMPRRRRRTSGRGRVLIVVAAVVLFVLFTSLRGWPASTPTTSGSTTSACARCGAASSGPRSPSASSSPPSFFVLCFVNLTIADRTAPAFRPPGPEDEMLSRYHDLDRPSGLAGPGRRVAAVRPDRRRRRVGRVEPVDPVHATPSRSASTTPRSTPTSSFYVFRLPFYQSVVQWLFASLIIILLITVVADYLNGGIRLQTPMQRVTPQVKAHLSVLLALLSLVKAADYWLQRYALTFSTRGFVERRHLHRREGAAAGAQPADVHRPALVRAVHLQHLAPGLDAAGRGRRPVGAGRRSWPAPPTRRSCRSFEVLPTESSKEAPYIDHNIAATRQALEHDRRCSPSSSSPTRAAADASKAIERQPARRCATSGCSTRRS